MCIMTETVETVNPNRRERKLTGRAIRKARWIYLKAATWGLVKLTKASARSILRTAQLAGGEVEISEQDGMLTLERMG